MDNQKQLREHLVQLLKGGQAHASIEDAVKGLPFELTGVKPTHVPYSVWQLLEHIRIAQWDIVQFSHKADHVSPKWPDEFWPKNPKPESEKVWHDTLHKIQKDRKQMIDSISDSKQDLYTAFPYGDGQTLLREALLIVDHTSYHTGEIILVRRLLKAWDK